MILQLLGLGAALILPPRRREIVVDPAGPVTTLTAALRLARPGDRIIVRAGHYAEPTIVVDKPVSITGEGRPVFDGLGNRQIITVTADSVSIRGLVLRDVGASAVEDRAAIKFVQVKDCVAEDNEIVDGFFGIYLSKSTDCRIAGNRIRGRGTSETLAGNALHLWSSARVTVERNDVEGYRDGIYLEFSSDSRVVGNRSARNLRYGLHFMFSHGCEYRDNVFIRNGSGVAVMYSHNVSMSQNRFEHNWGAAAYGLLLKDITDSRLTDNSFSQNTVGLYLDGATRMEVTGNALTGNGWAVRILADASDNQFSGNSFEGNSFDVGTNSTSNSSRFDRNYWDHYTGYDLDRDGVGDVPYHPVRLFSMLVEQGEPALILLRSFFIDLLEVAERVAPALTPETLIDSHPLMRKPRP